MWPSATNSCGARAALDLAAHVIDPADQRDIEIGVAAEVIVDARASLDHAGQDVVDVIDRKSVVHAVVAHRAFRSSARAIPRLAFSIALAAEQDDFAVAAARNQREHGLGFRKSGQVMEVAVLPVRIVAVVVAQPLRRRRHDANRIAPDDSHQLLAAARVLFAVDHLRAGARD
jgi:hypothetical protein